MRRRTILLVFTAMLLVIASACSTTSDNSVATTDATATADTTATPTPEATATPKATATPTVAATPEDYDFEEEATEVEGGGDFGIDEEDSTYVDPALVGRWRSSNGGALTITADGLITDVDFNCWTGAARIQNGVNDPSLQSIQISTDNGRANCEASFVYNWKYKIYLDELSITEDEILNMPLDSLAEYRRTEPGDGIEGTWSSTLDGREFYSFYDDGSGWHETRQHTYYIYYWTTNPDENGNDVITFVEEDPSYFDYSVSGDILTIYLSDGARTYQRVGY